MYVVSQDNFADLTQRRAHRSHLEEHVYAVAIVGEHSLKPGHLPGNAFQSRLGIATGSFIHEPSSCMVRAAVTEPVTNRVHIRSSGGAAA